ncbi:MAG TPA: prepilin-type N-terminal cleavage/methylation domain-containing protein [Gemmatimonadales bacterium]
MTSGRGGFTLIETLVAIVILGIGLLAMAATSGAVTTTLVGSRMATQATQLSNMRMEQLRATARSTQPPCTAAGFASSGAATVSQGVTITWVVPATGASRRVRVIASYPIGRGRTRTDTLITLVRCA